MISAISAIREFSQSAGYNFSTRLEDSFPAMCVAAITSSVAWYVVLVIIRFSAFWLNPSLRTGFDDDFFSPIKSSVGGHATVGHKVATGSLHPKNASGSDDTPKNKRDTDGQESPNAEDSEISADLTPQQIVSEKVQISDKTKAVTVATGKSQKSKAESVSVTKTSDSAALSSIVFALLFGPFFLGVVWILVEAFQQDGPRNSQRIGVNDLSVNFFNLSDRSPLRIWFYDSDHINPKICRLIGIHDFMACFNDENGNAFSVPLGLLGQGDIAELRRVDSGENELFPEVNLPFRMWTDASGSYKKELRIVGVLGSMVALEDRNGFVKLVPFYDLGENDLEYVTIGFPKSNAKSSIRKRSAGRT